MKKLVKLIVENKSRIPDDTERIMAICGIFI